ncbi:MAG: sulfate ABC transporter substrate-binding protein [Lentisphaeria bacterium]|nr:sulfate ABC transporter substrate-binding protein [Candidatus Neomarinimicrobiota bacterium]MCF7842316.1 sulfate ABC transporter substrate-binding protein [Lentisphaeria bacterium]
MKAKSWRIADPAGGLIVLFTLLLWSCGGKPAGDKTVSLTLGAYTVPKEAYEREIIPAFKTYWQEKTGETVTFNESYTASGAQSRAIASGFDADIAALSLEQDVQRLVEVGLVTHDWRATQFSGMVTRSIVVMAYREGNPKRITGWEDLTRPDVNVIYPSPKTSGGAMWVVNAIYGAALKHSEILWGEPDPNFAYRRLREIQSRVQVMDKSGRASVTTFENGIGDVLLTYENEVLLRKSQGKAMPFLVPDATILIENPIAVVDKNVEKHGNRAVAEAFVAFVKTASAQRAFAQYGFRPVDPDIAEEFLAKFPVPKHLFTIQDLGGWPQVHQQLYAQTGIWMQIVNELAHQ